MPSARTAPLSPVPPAAPMGTFETPLVGDYFEIKGPGHWRPSSRGGWQPRAWSSYPGDTSSTLITQERLYIDFGGRFQALEIREGIVAGHIYLAARIEVRGEYVWTNVAKDRVPWVLWARG